MSEIGCKCKTPNYNPIGRCLSCGGFHEGTNSNPTIDDMNEAIAIFDGWAKRSKTEFEKDGYMRHTWEFQYHSSWDCLMPVVAKIPKLIHATDELKLRREMSARWKPIENELCNVNINNVHYCLFRFIQWYNKQKEANNERPG